MYKNIFLVALTNIIIVCLAQLFYWLILIEIIDMAIFQFLIFPLMIIFLNIFLWFSKFKIEFYQHSSFAYLAFFLSVIFSFFISLDPSKELPPGETILHADVLFIIFVSTLQLIILLLLNIIMYIFYKIFSKKNFKLNC